MTKFLTTLALTLSGLLFCATSQASSIDFVIGNNSSATLYNTDFDGGTLSTTLASSLAGQSFSLSPGVSETFDFFDINITGCFVCGGESNIAATLDFLSPSASATGDGWGEAVSFLGFLTAGSLTWTTQPGIISTALGSFSVAFQDLSGLDLGSPISVQATVTAISAVPLPAAAWLFGSALLGFAGIRSRKRGAVKAAAATA